MKTRGVIPEPIILEIYGQPITEDDKKYMVECAQLILELNLTDSVLFMGIKKAMLKV